MYDLIRTALLAAVFMLNAVTAQQPRQIQRETREQLQHRPDTGVLARGYVLLPQAEPAPVRSAPPNTQEPILPVVAPFEMPQLQRPDIPAREYDIRAYGAKEGGLSKNTDAIRKAVTRAANEGGGTVVVPPGKWLTGPIHLESNIRLHLQAGAELLFSQDFDDYLPVVFSRHEDIECYKYSAFIYADGKTNIAITGEGTLDGQGNPWWVWKQSQKDAEKLLYEMGTNNLPVRKRIFDGKGGNALRPAFFQPMRCKNILVEGVTFKYGAFWTITPTYCENVIVRNVRIITTGDEGHAPNGDGVDPSSCRNVLIENCEFNTGDDCIAIKAGRDRDGLRVGIATENVVIRNCTGFQGHGGIVVGSETSGGIRNVYATHCQFSGTDRIVRIKTARGRGGVIEKLWFDNLSGEHILLEAIHLNMLYTGSRMPAQPVSDATPTLRDIHFENISCTSGDGYAVEFLGLPERAIENVTIAGLTAATRRGINCSDVRDLRFTDVNITPKSGPVVTIVDGEDITLDSLNVSVGTTELLRVEGARSREIRIRSTSAPALRNLISLSPEVSREAVCIMP